MPHTVKILTTQLETTSWRNKIMDAPYFWLLCGRGTHYSMFFGNNSYAMRWTQISINSLLLHDTTRHIHRTHSKVGWSSPLGVGVRLCFFGLSSFFALACRPNDLQIITEICSYLGCLLIDFEKVDCYKISQWPSCVFQDGCREPE